jgi:hypothetical protein
MWTSFKREQNPEAELQTCRCNTRGKTGSAKQPVSAAANSKRVRLFERRDQSLKGESSEGEIPWALRDEINSIGSRRSKPLKRWKTLRAERIRQGKAWVKWTPGSVCAEGKETPREARAIELRWLWQTNSLKESLTLQEGRTNPTGNGTRVFKENLQRQGKTKTKQGAPNQYGATKKPQYSKRESNSKRERANSKGKLICHKSKSSEGAHQILTLFVRREDRPVDRSRNRAWACHPDIMPPPQEQPPVGWRSGGRENSYCRRFGTPNCRG